MIRYGDVCWCELPPMSANTPKKTRPYLVVSNDFNNYGSNVVQVVPFTSHDKRLDLPCHVSTNYGMAQVEKVMTVDKNLVGQKLGTLNEVEMRQIKTALMVQFGIL